MIKAIIFDVGGVLIRTVDRTPRANLEQRLGLAPGDKVTVETRRGAITLSARQDPDVAEGMVFIPFCFVEAAANVLTNPQLDPMGKIPEFKFCAARVSGAENRQAAE